MPARSKSRNALPWPPLPDLLVSMVHIFLYRHPVRRTPQDLIGGLSTHGLRYSSASPYKSVDRGSHPHFMFLVEESSLSLPYPLWFHIRAFGLNLNSVACITFDKTGGGGTPQDALCFLARDLCSFPQGWTTSPDSGDSHAEPPRL